MRKPLAERFEKRLRVGTAVGFVIGGLIVARLVQVQVVEAGTHRDEARSQQERTLEVPAARGAIVDRAGSPLAVTLPADRRGTHDADRLHPKDRLAAQVVGHCAPDGSGLEGVELAFDEELRGTPGSRVVGANARGMRFTTPGSRVRPADDGATIVLTIDADAQSVLERELERCVEKTKASAASAVLMDPRTGDILAMASYPSYDPEDAGSFPAAARRNRALCDINEPGSTFKLVTVAAALEEGVASTETILPSSKSIELADGRPLRDKKDYGDVTVAEALTLSVNTATAHLARLVGSARVYEYARAFGFGCVTGLELPGEASGILRRPEHWSGRSLETISIGQEVAVTPVQLASAYAAIANDGMLLKPRIVRAVREPNGRTVREFPVRTVRQVVSRVTAQRLTEILTNVVEHGTGTEARIPGVPVAGKTGTAQRIDPETGRYDPRRHVSSFVGFLPAYDPQLVGAVVVDRPDGVGYGGQVAAPCFRRIVEGTLLRSREPSALASASSL